MICRAPDFVELIEVAPALDVPLPPEAIALLAAMLLEKVEADLARGDTSQESEGQ